MFFKNKKLEGKFKIEAVAENGDINFYVYRYTKDYDSQGVWWHWKLNKICASEEGAKYYIDKVKSAEKIADEYNHQYSERSELSELNEAIQRFNEIVLQSSFQGSKREDEDDWSDF